MSGAAPEVFTKSHKEELARKFKDNDDPMKIAIVVDMWLTGFDVPMSGAAPEVFDKSSSQSGANTPRSSPCPSKD